MTTVRKAIIPAAGLGTRLLPASKAVPKELFPVGGKPVIQYVVEEAARSGITDILIVIGPGKEAIQTHFAVNAALEKQLQDKGKRETAEALRAISNLARIHYIWQQQPDGLGDAIRYGKSFVGNEPFAVLLGDCILDSDSDQPVLQQLLHHFHRRQASVVAIEEIFPEKADRYGIMGGVPTEEPGLYKVHQWVEKPAIAEAPSNLAVAGRYVFTPHVFALLENAPTGKNDEVQLTDAMQALLQQEDMYALRFVGKRYDVGSHLDFVLANLGLGMNVKKMSSELQHWLKRLG